MLTSLAGHWYTVAPFVRHVIRPAQLPASRPFELEIDDSRFGQIRLRGRLHAPDHARELVVIVHGLGGSADSHYVHNAVAASLSAGLACLRVNLRGADRSGEDFYHAGLSSDLAAILASPELARFEQIVVLGYSLGGHLTLRLATDAHDARLRAVAAVCAPLDLDRSASEIDAGHRWIYRRHVLSGLREMYRAFSMRRSPELPLSVASQIRSIRKWDDRIVAPRHGFRSAEHYYAEASVAPRLAALELPALLLQAAHDPMVPAASVRPALASASRALEVRFVDGGGHVGFREAVEPEIIDWFQRHF